jgi:hypothetical protein
LGRRSEAAVLNGVASHTAQGRPFALRIEETEAPHATSFFNVVKEELERAEKSLMWIRQYR